MSELSTSWHSYPKVYALGHSVIGALLFAPLRPFARPSNTRRSNGGGRGAT